MKTIAVIGGGASGMMAAITAARLGAQVTIYEHKDRVGKKILTTGNGKCNLTNLSVSEDDYRGDHPPFVIPVLERFSVSDTLHFFEELGLFWKERGGCVYPVSNQASTVLNLLRTELKRLGVEVLAECGKVSIRQIHKKAESGFEVSCGAKKRRFDRVILAAGGKAAPSTGSDGSGYALARSLGHTIIPVLPALTSLKGDERFFKPVAGVRVDARLKLFTDGDFCGEETGELQLTAQGVSGIAVFQLSRYAIRALERNRDVYLLCDFLPLCEQKQLLRSLRARRQRGLSAEEALDGILNKKLLFLLLGKCKIKPSEPISVVSDRQMQQFCQMVKQCPIPITGYASFEHAQVCQGGVDTRQLTGELESKLCQGLYFAGEIVDVDGSCGGYNLQWAWSSGAVAGGAAAREESYGGEKRMKKIH